MEGSTKATLEFHNIRVFGHPEPEASRNVVLEREIPSDAALIGALVVRVVEACRSEGLFPDDGEAAQSATCLEEALRNAIAHGNGNDFSKKVQVQVFVKGAEWGYTVQDEGQGFNLLQCMGRIVDDAPLREYGRGLRIISHYMDTVEYFEGGAFLVMTKKMESE